MPQDFEQSIANAADAAGNVTDAQVMDILAGAMTTGETWAKPQDDGVPNADATTTDPVDPPVVSPAPAPAAPAPAPAAPAPVAAAPAASAPALNADPDAVPPGTTPVVLAKDGVHTIDYTKLVDARQKAADAVAENQRLAAELADARAKLATPAPAPAAPAAAPAPAADPDAPLFGDYTDADLRKGVQALLDRQAAALRAELRAEFDGKLQPVEVERQVAAKTAHLNTILTAHPDAPSIVESQEFEAWKAAQPTIVRTTIESVQDKGSAADMVDVLNMYRAAHPRQVAQAPAAPAPAPAPAAPAVAAAPTAQALAAKAIAEASTRTPTTLSDIPAGSQAVLDETAAMEQMSPLDLMNKMMSMSPEQIETLQRRFV
jgi:hypothetical protein